MDEISKYRLEIDNVDKQIISDLITRIKLAKNVIDLKISQNLSIEDNLREEIIISKLSEEFNDSIDIEFIKSIYNLIFKYVKAIDNSNFSISQIIANKPFLISGPCAVESVEQINNIATQIKSKGIKLFRAGAFKPRTSPNSFQGMGEEGLLWAYEAAKKNNLFLVSEILDSSQLEKYIDLIDIVQIGSRNMASYQLLKDVGKITAKNNKYVLLKRGYSSTLNEFLNAAVYITQYGNSNVILCLRGIRTFEQIDSELRNTPDLASISELKSKTKLPICFDASHSTGNSKFVLDISKAALILNADGLMIETHNNPEKALIDGQQSITPDVLDIILNFIKY